MRRWSPRTLWTWAPPASRATPSAAHSTVLWLILAIVCGVGAVMAVVLAVPRWRQQVSGKLRPRFATVRNDFRQLATQPSKVVQLIGRQVAAQLVAALALGAALHAFGAHLSVAALIIAVTVAGVLASASPVEGWASPRSA